MRRHSVFQAGLVGLVFAGVSTVMAAAPAPAAPTAWRTIPLGWLATAPPSTSDALDINDAGMVVGESYVGASRTHAFAWTPTGGMVDLGTLGGSISSAAAAGPDGTVLGTSSLPGDSTLDLFTWTVDEGMTSLGSLGGSSIAVLDMNATGAYTGGGTAQDGRQLSLDGSPHPGYGFSAFTALDSSTSWGTAINDAGTITGTALVDTGPAAVFHAYVTVAYGEADLGTLDSSPYGHSTAVDINNAGDPNHAAEVVIGNSSAGAAEHAFIWNDPTTGGGMHDLGTLGGSWSEAAAMNNSAEVTGLSATATGDTHAFYWSPAGGMVDLGTLGGSYSKGVAINDAGQIAGVAETSAGERHAFVWTTTTGMIDLGNGAGKMSEVTDINSKGQVIGSSWTPAFRSRQAVLWTPVTADIPPEAPTDPSIGESSTDLVVSWVDRSQFETGFEIERARWTGTEWSEWFASSAPANATSWTDPSLPDGKYAYLVRSYNPAGVSSWVVATIVHSTAAAPPTAPTTLQIDDNGSDLHLTWSDRSADELGFEIMRTRLVTGEWSEWTAWATDRNAQTFVDAALDPGTYAYLIRSYNAVGSSGWTVVVIDHPPVTAIPAAPTDLMLDDLGWGVAVGWSDRSDNESIFEIERATYDETTGTWGSWTSWLADHNQTDWTDWTAPSGTYAYLVRATNSLGSSEWLVGTIVHMAVME